MDVYQLCVQGGHEDGAAVCVFYYGADVFLIAADGYVVIIGTAQGHADLGNVAGVVGIQSQGAFWICPVGDGDEGKGILFYELADFVQFFW